MLGARSDERQATIALAPHAPRAGRSGKGEIIATTARAELPTGTVTFLFTDVESSTRLLHEHGADYAGLLADHRAAVRGAFTRYDGVEVDTQGDAFFVAFARAADAVAAAAAAREALRGGPVRVRMGIHTGEPQVTDEGYVGIAELRGPGRGDGRGRKR